MRVVVMLSLFVVLVMLVVLVWLVVRVVGVSYVVLMFNNNNEHAHDGKRVFRTNT